MVNAVRAVPEPTLKRAIKNHSEESLIEKIEDEAVKAKNFVKEGINDVKGAAKILKILGIALP